MIQFYLLSLVYILLGAGLLLVERYGGNLLFLIDIKSNLYRNRWWQLLLIPFGFLIFLGLLIFPVDPGPIIIGDLVPAIVVFILMCHYINSTPGKTFRQKIRRLFNNQADYGEPMEKAEQVLANTVGLEDIDERFAGHAKMKRFLGWVCLVTGGLHFLFPSFVLI